MITLKAKIKAGVAEEMNLAAEGRDQITTEGDEMKLRISRRMEEPSCGILGNVSGGTHRAWRRVTVQTSK